MNVMSVHDGILRFTAVSAIMQLLDWGCCAVQSCTVDHLQKLYAFILDNG